MLPIALTGLAGVMEKFLEDSGNRELNEKVLDLYFQISSFLDICDRLDECYVIYTELQGDGRFMIRLFCVDPSVNIQECLNKGNSTIYFSATLLPIDYYKRLLSREPETGTGRPGRQHPVHQPEPGGVSEAGRLYPKDRAGEEGKLSGIFLFL